MDANDKNLPTWQKPAVTPLGDLAAAHGQRAPEEKCHNCTGGFSATQVCGNGNSAQVQQCKTGFRPPSNSCANGFGGS